MNIFEHLSALVVDSDPMYCVVVRENLHLLGFNTVHTATLARAALSLLSFSEHDIVFMEMAECYEAVWQELSEKEQTKPLVLATSFERDVRTRLRAVRKGADGFVEKDFTKTSLNGALVRLLTGEAARRSKVVLLPTAHINRFSES